MKMMCQFTKSDEQRTHEMSCAGMAEYRRQVLGVSDALIRKFVVAVDRTDGYRQQLNEKARECMRRRAQRNKAESLAQKRVRYAQRQAGRLAAMSRVAPKLPAGLAESPAGRVAERVAGCFDYTLAQLRLESRAPKLVWARQVAMTALYAWLQLPSAATARALNREDHSTVLYGFRRVKSLCETEKNCAGEVAAVLALLQAEELLPAGPMRWQPERVLAKTN